jgi:hypothetical protein
VPRTASEWQQRIWAARRLQPHRVRRFKLSQDPAFADKLRDVVGLYLDPPAHSLVLSVDEKPQIQTFDRTQPGLPMKKGRAGTMTISGAAPHAVRRVNVFDGTVIGKCMARPRHQEFIRFLDRIEAVVPAGPRDNYGQRQIAALHAGLGDAAAFDTGAGRVLGRHQPEIGHELAQIGEARQVAQFSDQRCRIDQRHAAHRLQRRHDRGQRPVRQHRLDLRRQPVAPRVGGFNRLNVVFEHNVMRCLGEAQTGQPPPMQLGPCRTPIMAALAQQEPGELLSGPPQRAHRVEARPHQVAYRLMPRIGNPHCCQRAGPVQLRQTGCVPPIGLDPVARPLRNQGGGDDNAVVPGRRQLALDAVTARPRLRSFRHSVKWALAAAATADRSRIRRPGGQSA